MTDTTKYNEDNMKQLNNNKHNEKPEHEKLDLSKEYKDYLKKYCTPRLSDGVIDNYITALRGKNIKEFKAYGNIGEFDIYSISDISEFRELKNKIRSSDRFKEINDKSSGLSQSLDEYENFLELRENPDAVKEVKPEKTQEDQKPEETKEIEQQKNDVPHQLIYFGAPGTGKSYQLNKDAKEMFGENYERVTFHPNYMYGSFVGAFKPFPKTLDNKDAYGNEQEIITYEYVPGILINQLVKAFEHPDIDYLVIVEEINRANVAAVFGDIFQLLDRDSNGDSEYPIATSEELKRHLVKTFKKKKKEEDIKLNEEIQEKLGDDFSRLYLPKNFYIWATMNSADQGVMPIDTAFKRRWDFKYLGINDAVKHNKNFDKYEFKISKETDEKVKWDDFRRAVNEKMANLNIPEDKLMGPYFISKTVLEDADIDIDKVTNTVKNKVLMYLYEDAAKAFRSDLFEEDKYKTYSSLCDNFDKNALKIFKGGLKFDYTNSVDNNDEDSEKESNDSFKEENSIEDNSDINQE